jgi:hypothetical protein
MVVPGLTPGLGVGGGMTMSPALKYRHAKNVSKPTSTTTAAHSQRENLFGPPPPLSDLSRSGSFAGNGPSRISRL